MGKDAALVRLDPDQRPHPRSRFCLHSQVRALDGLEELVRNGPPRRHAQAPVHRDRNATQRTFGDEPKAGQRSHLADRVAVVVVQPLHDRGRVGRLGRVQGCDVARSQAAQYVDRLVLIDDGRKSLHGPEVLEADVRTEVVGGRGTLGSVLQDVPDAHMREDRILRACTRLVETSRRGRRFAHQTREALQGLGGTERRVAPVGDEALAQPGGVDPEHRTEQGQAKPDRERMRQPSAARQA